MIDLRGLDPRPRVAGTLAFAVATLALERPATIAGALLGAAAATLLFRVPPASTGRRLLAAQASLLLVVVTLPFTVPGEPLLRVGPLAASEAGSWRAAEIALRANAILLAVTALVGSLETSRLGYALHRLHAPATLVGLLLFTVRYLALLEQEYGRLRTAMRARGFRPRSDRHTWRSLGQLGGMVLVRSAARAERVMEAMRCRGYAGRVHVLDDLHWRPADSAFAAALALGIASLLALDRW